MSTDSWGVDYLLFDSDGSHYRADLPLSRSADRKGVETVLAKVDWKTIFAETGHPVHGPEHDLPTRGETPERLKQAALILSIGDGFNYLLGGKAVIEQSMASTFQLYNPRTGDWSDVARRPWIAGAVVSAHCAVRHAPGIALRPIAEETGLAGVEVVASCSHDTGAAVAAVPGSGENWAYLSSGTWSLMGVELQSADHQRRRAASSISLTRSALADRCACSRT